MDLIQISFEPADVHGYCAILPYWILCSKAELPITVKLSHPWDAPSGQLWRRTVPVCRQFIVVLGLLKHRDGAGKNPAI